MKKIILGVGLLLLFRGNVFSFEAMSGNYYGQGIGLSSATNVNGDWLWYSTGNIIITYLQISSPGVNSNIFFQEVASTVAAGKFRVTSGSTLPYYTGLPTTQYTNGNGIWLGFQVSKSTGSGWTFATTGDKAAKIRVFYDYITPPNR